MYTTIVIQPKKSYLSQLSFPAVLNSEKGTQSINLVFLWTRKQNMYNIARYKKEKK